MQGFYIREYIRGDPRDPTMLYVDGVNNIEIGWTRYNRQTEHISMITAIHDNQFGNPLIRFCETRIIDRDIDNRVWFDLTQIAVRTVFVYGDMGGSLLAKFPE